MTFFSFFPIVLIDIVIMQGEKRDVLPTKSLVSWNYCYQMKAFITEIRMELESSLYCVWLLSCTFVWQNLLSPHCIK